MAKERLLLIDGHSIVNRAFYGIPPLTNAEGLHTNAILGFLNIFLNAYKEFAPNYCMVAFDVRSKTFRHDLYPEYKGTRKGMPDELHEQVPVLQDVLRAMGVEVATLEGYEADDVIGTYARIAHDDGLEVVILSGDRDLLQLATDETLVAIPKTKQGGTEVEKYFAKDVEARYGVTPAQFIEMKALMGDQSDNIPGIPGIGEKTASALIGTYKTLEGAYEHADEISQKRARENLKEFIEQGRMSLVLATINTHSPVKADYHDSKVESEKAFYNKESYELLKRLELNKILARFDVDSLERPEEITYEVKDASELPEAVDGPFGLYVDPDRYFTAVCTGGGTTVYRGWSEHVCDLLKGKNEVRCFSLKQLLHTLDAKDFSSDNVFDIEIMAYLMNPLMPSYNYDNISKDYLGRVIPSKADIYGKSTAAELMLTEPDKAYKCAAYSAAVAFESKEVLQKALEEAGMWKLFTDIEMPLVYSLYNMEREGICVNREALAEFSARLSDMADELQGEIFAEAGEEFNINSPAQLGTILFEKLKLPHGKKTKTGYSTSAQVLEKLAEDFPFVTKILKYRQVVKLRSTYAEGLPAFISEDGRIHGTFNQTITATGRISSTEPNLQNIPIRTELGQEIRKAFAAKEGCVFIDADYSQIELRLLAHFSGDENLIEAYYTDADIHKVTASKVFHTPLDQVTKEQRSNAKAVNFGIVYGISSFGLGQGLSITPKQAGEYIKQYFETYPGVKAYLDRTVSRARMDGYVTTLYGRRRPIPELASTNFMQRSFGERVAMNSPLQGTAADIMKIAMINVDRALRSSGLAARVVLQIHDELLVETPLDEREKVKEILYREMKNAADLKVPLEVDVQEGADWYEAH